MTPSAALSVVAPAGGPLDAVSDLVLLASIAGLLMILMLMLVADRGRRAQAVRRPATTPRELRGNPR